MRSVRLGCLKGKEKFCGFVGTVDCSLVCSRTLDL